MWIIQVEVKAIVVALDSELFSCRYTQTQYYTLATPTGSCGSKNERPNNTHLNLGGTQMSLVFLELRHVLLQLPLKLCKSLFCVFIRCCSQYRMACLRSDPWKSLRHGGDEASGTLWSNTKTPACLHSSIYNLPSMIYRLRLSLRFKKASKGKIQDGS